MTSEYYRQRIWAVQQQCGSLEVEICEKQHELEKLRSLSAQIKDSEVSFFETCEGYSMTLQRMSSLERATKAQGTFVQGVRGFLSGQDYQHAANCFAIMKSRSAEMEDKAENELNQKRKALSKVKGELSYLRRQLEIALAQESAQDTP